MKLLTLNEEVLLLAVHKLGENAYPVLIREEVIAMTGKSLVYGALYNSLDYLLKKGFVSSSKGDPTPEKGGKRKIYFTLSEDGRIVLEKTREFRNSIWIGIEGFADGKTIQ